jgi:hypothetical protein
MVDTVGTWWKNPPPWLAWIVLGLTVIGVIFQVIGPINPERLNKVPGFVDVVFRFLLTYSIYIALGFGFLLVYWMRRYAFRALVWAKEWLYIRPLVFLLRPAVQRIVQRPVLPVVPELTFDGGGVPINKESAPGMTTKGSIPGWTIVGNWEVQENEIENWEFGDDWIRGKNFGTVLWQQRLPNTGRIGFEARVVEDLGSDEIDVLIGDSMALYYSAGVRLDYMADDLSRDRGKNMVAWPKPQLGQWYRYIVAKTSEKCILMIDGQRVMDIPWDRGKTKFRGRIGFSHWHNRIEFRNLQIGKLA